jgi:hypothetical protein
MPAAAGVYPNQSRGGDGLPAWTKPNRSIANTDLVLGTRWVSIILRSRRIGLYCQPCGMSSICARADFSPTVRSWICRHPSETCRNRLLLQTASLLNEQGSGEVRSASARSARIVLVKQTLCARSLLTVHKMLRRDFDESCALVNFRPTYASRSDRGPIPLLQGRDYSRGSG